MTVPLILPDPACSFGYPLGQVQELLSDEERYGAFLVWLRGQTVGSCTGEWWDVVRRQRVPSLDHPAHGPVVFAADLHRFLQQAAA